MPLLTFELHYGRIETQVGKLVDIFKVDFELHYGRIETFLKNLIDGKASSFELHYGRIETELSIGFTEQVRL